MKKLELDELSVESFDTTVRAAADRGTVHAEQQCTCPTYCTCPGCNTCDPSFCDTSCFSCGGTCGASCYASCEDTCYVQDTCRESCDTNC